METNLPDNIKDRAVSVFKAAVSEKYVIKDIIEKVQRDALSEVENVFRNNTKDLILRPSIAFLTKH